MCENGYLQQAYFKCAYECFDRRKKQDEINDCVERCSIPVLQAQNLVEGEMAKFQVSFLFSFIFPNLIYNVRLPFISWSSMLLVNFCIERSNFGSSLAF